MTRRRLSKVISRGLGAVLRRLKPNPLRRDPVWREADRKEREARAKHARTRPFQEAKTRRVHELLAGR